MITLIVVVLTTAAYVSGWATTTRALFRRWRPSRVRLCGSWGTHTHDSSCRYRRTPAGTVAAFDSASHAIWGAAVASLFWPAVLIALWLMSNPPGTASGGKGPAGGTPGG